MDYFIADGAAQRGPLRLEQVAQAGVRPDTLVWCEGMSQWQRADSVPALALLFNPPRVGPPSAPPMAAPSALYAPHAPGISHGAPVQYATPMQYPAAPYDPGASSSKVAAGICGILLGTFGVHKFILGMPLPGIIMLLASVLTCGMAIPIVHIIGVVEGVIYLTKSDAEFYQLYVVQKRPWF